MLGISEYCGYLGAPDIFTIQILNKQFPEYIVEYLDFRVGKIAVLHIKSIVDGGVGLDKNTTTTQNSNKFQAQKWSLPKLTKYREGLPTVHWRCLPIPTKPAGRGFAFSVT